MFDDRFETIAWKTEIKFYLIQSKLHSDIGTASVCEHQINSYYHNYWLEIDVKWKKLKPMLKRDDKTIYSVGIQEFLDEFVHNQMNLYACVSLCDWDFCFFFSCGSTHIFCGRFC